MKALMLLALLAAASFFAGSGAWAQYKAPSQYLPKTNSAPRPGGQPPSRPPSAVPQQPKFKDVPVNSQFYFLADTNRAFAWTKTSATTAKNSKTGTAQVINGETPVQR